MSSGSWCSSYDDERDETGDDGRDADQQPLTRRGRPRQRRPVERQQHATHREDDGDRREPRRTGSVVPESDGARDRDCRDGTTRHEFNDRDPPAIPDRRENRHKHSGKADRFEHEPERHPEPEKKTKESPDLLALL